jgi:hypothetical protein
VSIINPAQEHKYSTETETTDETKTIWQEKGNTNEELG